MSIVRLLAGSRFAKPEVVTKVNQMAENMPHCRKWCESTSFLETAMLIEQQAFWTGIGACPPRCVLGTSKPTPNMPGVMVVAVVLLCIVSDGCVFIGIACGLLSLLLYCIVIS